MMTAFLLTHWKQIASLAAAFAVISAIWFHGYISGSDAVKAEIAAKVQENQQQVIEKERKANEDMDKLRAENNQANAQLEALKKDNDRLNMLNDVLYLDTIPQAMPDTGKNTTGVRNRNAAKRPNLSKQNQACIGDYAQCSKTLYQCHQIVQGDRK